MGSRGHEERAKVGDELAILTTICLRALRSSERPKVDDDEHREQSATPDGSRGIGSIVLQRERPRAEAGRRPGDGSHPELPSSSSISPVSSLVSRTRPTAAFPHISLAAMRKSGARRVSPIGARSAVQLKSRSRTRERTNAQALREIRRSAPRTRTGMRSSMLPAGGRRGGSGRATSSKLGAGVVRAPSRCRSGPGAARAARIWACVPVSPVPDGTRPWTGRLDAGAEGEIIAVRRHGGPKAHRPPSERRTACAAKERCRTRGASARALDLHRRGTPPIIAGATPRLRDAPGVRREVVRPLRSCAHCAHVASGPRGHARRTPTPQTHAPVTPHEWVHRTEAPATHGRVHRRRAGTHASTCAAERRGCTPHGRMKHLVKTAAMTAVAAARDGSLGSPHEMPRSAPAAGRVMHCCAVCTRCPQGALAGGSHSGGSPRRGRAARCAAHRCSEIYGVVKSFAVPILDAKRLTAHGHIVAAPACHCHAGRGSHARARPDKRFELGGPDIDFHVGTPLAAPPLLKISVLGRGLWSTHPLSAVLRAT
ncbi:hypothetical protein FB451DRAFT_1369953 [Mycena latifolia]|nr:hypothetical protein FB451DRAFT_1369953 [Mycena latifolia]